MENQTRTGTTKDHNKMIARKAASWILLDQAKKKKKNSEIKLPTMAEKLSTQSRN